jgi:hypothetical protein
MISPDGVAENYAEALNMTAMAEQIFDLVSSRRTVTFAELENHIEGFGGGDKTLIYDGDRCSNIVLWAGLTDAAIDAMEELRIAKRIHPIPANILTYLMDGKCLRLPIAKAGRHYKKPHWVPVVFNPGADPKSGRPKRRS